MLNQFPKNYKKAAELLKLASEENRNVKHLLYNDAKNKFFDIKSLFAIVTNALKHWDVIETLIKESNILKEHDRLNIWRVRVIITELLFANKTLKNHVNNTIQTVLQYQEIFDEILSKGQRKKLIRSVDEVESDITKVRFIKVNPIKENVLSVIERFQDEGWDKLETAASYEDYLQQLRNLKKNSPVFLQDFHIPDVLAFPAGTELQSHELYLNGSIFFMNKSSCLAPLLLAPQRNSHVLDMCAAPGLKTIQLASYVPQGKVYAVERDAKRYQDLLHMVEQSGADNVITIHQDVTKLDLHQYKNVEYILLDPSCTGSGILGRQPSLKDQMDDKTRVKKLSGFQLTLLRFALTRFPAAKRVVYSTCSVNVEENEEVVEAALNSKYHNFDVVSVQNKLPEWQSFGSKDFQFGHKCVYCQTKTDFTNGFFVAVFERKKNQSDISCSNNEKRKNHPKQNEKVLSKKNKPDISFANNKNLIKKSKNHPKQNKKRFQEENNNDEDESLKVAPHKKLKLDHDQTESSIEKQLVAKNSHNKSEDQKLKLNGKTSKHLSIKKRDRKRKLKKKLISQSSQGKETRVKIKNHQSNDFIEKNVKIKNDKNILNCSNETKHKIHKSKLRRKRMRLLKLGLVSKSNGSSTQNLGEMSSNLDTLRNTEEVATKPRKKKKHKSPQGNISENPEAGGEISPVTTKEIKRKIMPEVTSNVDVSTTFTNINEFLSQNIETNEGKSTLKKKKKKHSLEDTRINIDHALCIENNDAKVSNLADVSNKTSKDIALKNSEIKEEPQKKKNKKKRSLDHYEKDISSKVNDDKNSNNSNKSNDVPSKNRESEHEKTNNKKYRKKTSTEYYGNNIINYEDENLDTGTIIDPICIDTKSNTSRVKETHKKKHRKTTSIDHYENNIINNEDGNLDTGTIIDPICIDSKSDTSRVKETHKKKHRKTTSIDHYGNNIINNEDENLNTGTIIDPICIDTKSNTSRVKETHKKKHRKTTSIDHYENNIINNEDENLDTGTIIDPICIDSKSDTSRVKETHKKKHRKTTSIDHYENNIINNEDGNLDTGTIIDPICIDTKSDTSRVKETHKKKHRKKTSIDHYENNIINNDDENLDTGTIIDPICIDSKSDTSRVKETHKKKHRKTTSIDHYGNNIINNEDENLNTGTIIDPICIDTKSNTSRVKETHKKKHRKTTSIDHYENNIINNEDENLDTGTIIDPICIDSKSDTSRVKETHKKKHRKTTSIDHYENNIINNEDGNLDTGTIIDPICIDTKSDTSRVKETHKKKHRKKTSIDHYENNIINNEDENLDTGTIIDPICIDSNSDTSRVKETHKKKHKKIHSLDNHDNNITSNVSSEKNF